MPATARPRVQEREEFGRRLRELRQQAQWTQEQLAHAAGLDRSFLADVEAGRHSIQLDRVYDLAEALEVHITHLFP